MKSLKVLFVALFVVALAGTVFAFTNQKESVAVEVKKAQVFYEYIGGLPITAQKLADPNNWALRQTNPCPQVGTNLCAIRFDNTQYTLAQAIAKVPVLVAYTNGANVGTAAAPVIIFTKP